jgi:hypothetical protein
MPDCSEALALKPQRAGESLQVGAKLAIGQLPAARRIPSAAALGRDSSTEAPGTRWPANASTASGFYRTDGRSVGSWLTVPGAQVPPTQVGALGRGAKN